MRTPTSEPDPRLKGLSEAQIQLLDRLYEAGENGIHMNRFFALATELGVEPDPFGELIKRNLLGTKVGNLYVHPDFLQ